MDEGTARQNEQREELGVTLEQRLQQELGKLAKSMSIADAANTGQMAKHVEALTRVHAAL